MRVTARLTADNCGCVDSPMRRPMWSNQGKDRRAARDRKARSKLVRCLSGLTVSGG